MKFRIDRSKWRSGGAINAGKETVGLGKTKMLNEQGFMCCLGQCCKQMGLTDRQLENAFYPSGCGWNKDKVEDDNPFVTVYGKEVRYLADTRLSSAAWEINDSLRFNTEEREEKLIDLFKEHGHELEFYGKKITRNHRQDEEE